MKFVFLAIFVLIGTMPVQASLCDMHDDSETTHALHGNMQMDENPAMDCCEQGFDGAPHGCDSTLHCGTCAAGISAMLPSAAKLLVMAAAGLSIQDEGAPLHKFYSPPFRPPIA